MHSDRKPEWASCALSGLSFIVAMLPLSATALVMFPKQRQILASQPIGSASFRSEIDPASREQLLGTFSPLPRPNSNSSLSSSGVVYTPSTSECQLQCPEAMATVLSTVPDGRLSMTHKVPRLGIQACVIRCNVGGRH